MTPTTAAEKVKEIATKFFRYWWNQKGVNTDEGFDQWVATEEGSRLVGELGEGWKEDVPEWEYTSFESETPLFSFEISKKVEAGKGWELCGIVSRPLDYIYYFKRPLPKPPKP